MKDETLCHTIESIPGAVGPFYEIAEGVPEEPEKFPEILKAAFETTKNFRMYIHLFLPESKPVEHKNRMRIDYDIRCCMRMVLPLHKKCTYGFRLEGDLDHWQLLTCWSNFRSQNVVHCGFSEDG